MTRCARLANARARLAQPLSLPQQPRPHDTRQHQDQRTRFGHLVVVSSTRDRVDWNAELLRGDLGQAVQHLKEQPGRGLYVAGVKLPLALAELGLIDEYEFIVHPRLAGHGPTLFAGLSQPLDLTPVGRLEFRSGAVAMRYEPRRWTAG